jgi:hypothetical protein
LIRNILTEMDDEERELFRGVRRRGNRALTARKRVETGEFPVEPPVLEVDEVVEEDTPIVRRGSD